MPVSVKGTNNASAQHTSVRHTVEGATVCHSSTAGQCCGADRTHAFAHRTRASRRAVAPHAACHGSVATGYDQTKTNKQPNNLPNKHTDSQRNEQANKRTSCCARRRKAHAAAAAAGENVVVRRLGWQASVCAAVGSMACRPHRCDGSCPVRATNTPRVRAYPFGSSRPQCSCRRSGACEPFGR